jgi:hypothetical protein
MVDMKTSALLLILAVPALSGCAMPMGGDLQDVRAITLESTACYGPCPIFSITVDRDGKGTYLGKRFVAQKGQHDFTVTPAQFEAFRARLAPFRPESSVSYGHDNCDGPLHTDDASAIVTWFDGARKTTLNWYFGCQQPGLAGRSQELHDAWQELPALEPLVGTAQDRFEYDAW